MEANKAVEIYYALLPVVIVLFLAFAAWMSIRKEEEK